LLSLTSRGEKVLQELSLQHRSELRTAGPALVKALRHVTQSGNGSRRRIQASA
jgi:hypothetical protein